MAISKPKKPHYKAMPKAPKMNASKEAWANYNKKVNEIQKINNALKADFEKKTRAYESEMKQREKIKEKARNAKL